MRIRVTQIIENQDMRKVYELWDTHLDLRKGQAVLAFNSKCSMVRIVLWTGLMGTQYASPGERFDVELTKKLFADVGWEISDTGEVTLAVAA